MDRRTRGMLAALAALLLAGCFDLEPVERWNLDGGDSDADADADADTDADEPKKRRPCHLAGR